MVQGRFADALVIHGAEHVEGFLRRLMLDLRHFVRGLGLELGDVFALDLLALVAPVLEAADRHLDHAAGFVKVVVRLIEQLQRPHLLG